MTLGNGNNCENSTGMPLSSASSDSSSYSSDTEYDCNNPQHEILAENYAHQERINIALAHNQLFNVAFGRQQRTGAVSAARQQRTNAESNSENVVNEDDQQETRQRNQQEDQQENHQGDQQENQKGDQEATRLFDYDEMFEQYMQDRGYPYRDPTATPARQFRLRQEEEMLRMTGLQILGWDSPSDYRNRGRLDIWL